MDKKPFVPTKLYPHRWCKVMHWAPAPFGLALLAFDLWHQWQFLLVMVAVGFATGFIFRKINGKSQAQMMIEERLYGTPKQIGTVKDSTGEEHPVYSGTGWHSVQVNKVWARIAVSLDAFWLAVLVSAASALFADPASAAKSASETPFTLPGISSMVVSMGAFAFTVYAHKKATRPRKPRREWLPAFLRSNV